MVTTEEIQHVAHLMRIQIENYQEHVDKIDAMIGYFDILDSAGVESEEISMKGIHVVDLREDKYIPFDKDLIKTLNHHKNDYIRAPKMS